MERLGKRFMWGHIEENEYLRERERLEAVRDELKAAAQPKQTIKLAGCWTPGTPAMPAPAMSCWRYCLTPCR